MGRTIGLFKLTLLATLSRVVADWFGVRKLMIYATTSL